MFVHVKIFQFQDMLNESERYCDATNDLQAIRMHPDIGLTNKTNSSLLALMKIRFLRTVVIITARLSVVYGSPEWTLIIEIHNKHYFAGQFSFKFCAKHFLTKILHFIKNEHVLSL